MINIENPLILQYVLKPGSRPATALLCLICTTQLSSGQATLTPIDVRTLAEVETRTLEAGRAVVKLAPADRVVPGDQLIYTLEVRNLGSKAIVAAVVIKAVPEHMQYVARSAAGPGADVSYSVDGGAHFDRPERLVVLGSDGVPHAAHAADYTHIRWQLKRALQPDSVAYARFRAVVK